MNIISATRVSQSLQKAIKIGGLCILSPLPLCGSAQDEADTLRTENLTGVVVEGEMQRTAANVSTFIPSSDQRKTAQNGFDLLRDLAIPQITISPVDDTVTTITGDGVSLFVNYLPASSAELEGLPMSDILRVEYLDFPSDPRFERKRHVVHFIIRQYDYGGYTKASVGENFLAGFSSGISLYSKLSYKRMTYDLYAGSSNLDLKHIGTTTESSFTLGDDENKHKTIERREEYLEGLYKENSYPLTLRASYSTDSMRISNTIGFTYSDNPLIRSAGRLTYRPAYLPDTDYTRNNPSRRRDYSWSGSYYFALSPRVEVNLSPYARYAHINDDSNYITDEMRIDNYAKEDQYTYGLSGTVGLTLSKEHYVMARVYYGDLRHHVIYSGTSPYENRFGERFGGLTLGYDYRDDRWSFSTDAALQWEENRINDQAVRELYPLINLSVGFSPSSKHSLRSYFHFGANYPGASEKSPNILRSNELMYITGNPDMGLSRQITYNLSYNWMPSNDFSLSVYNQYFGELGLFVPVYGAYEEGKALLRRYDTGEQYHRDQLGLSFNLRLLDGDLQWAASPSVTFYRMIGKYDLSISPLSFDTSLTYYLGDFYLQGYYRIHTKTLQGNRAAEYANRDYSYLRIGWSKGNLNIRLSGINLFRSDWNTSTLTFHSPLYSEIQYQDGNSMHRTLNLSITYTFDYGRKVNRGNEVGRQYGDNSAILK